MLVRKFPFLLLLFIFSGYHSSAQQSISLKQAVQLAIENYGTIKAKASYAEASKAAVVESRRDYLPNVNFSAQQDYGTINGQNAPIYGFNGLNTAASGPALDAQNWNAAFGALYLANVNWDFFSFGKAREKVKVQKTIVSLDENDLAQEQFQHEVRVASTYLNLLAAQQLAKAQEDNLNRSLDLQKVVVARVKNGLNPGVDSSLANAEVSNARIALTNAQQIVQDQSNQLAQYLGIQPQNFVLDSTFVSKAPPQPNVNPLIP